MSEERSYNIVRMYQHRDKPSRVIKSRVTEAEAREYCRDPETSSSTCTGAEGLARTRREGPWFDGYEGR